MKKPSEIFERWDVVVVPFPFTEIKGNKRRPALVISKKTFNWKGHTLLAMVTTKTHDTWPGDIDINEHERTGLNFPCIVRLKLFTLDNRLILKRIGHLTASDRKNVAKSFHQYFF